MEINIVPMHLGLIIILIIFSVLTDIIYRKIFNYITFSGVLAGILGNILLAGFDGLWFSLLGLLVGVAIFFPFFLANLLGAGDVKLMGAIGAILGVKMVLLTALYSVIIGSLLALFILAYHGKLFHTIKTALWSTYTLLSPHYRFELPSPKKSVQTPFALAMAIGAILAIHFNFLTCLFTHNLIK